MYSSAHAAVGATIVVSCPDPVTGLGFAFLSHFLLDYIGESSIRKSVQWEVSLLIVYLLAAAVAGELLLFCAAWIASNLPDLIDKPARWYLGRPEWFSCHNGPGCFQYKGRKLGYPTIVKLNELQTITANVLSTLLIALYIVLLHH